MREPDGQRIRLPLSWSFIEGVRSDIARATKDLDKDVREAAVMAASELAENSVKYGEPIQSEDCAYIWYSVRPMAIVIRTMNGVTTARRVEQVASCIDAINAVDDPGALYAQRLTEMLTSPSDE